MSTFYVKASLANNSASSDNLSESPSVSSEGSSSSEGTISLRLPSKAASRPDKSGASDGGETQASSQKEDGGGKTALTQNEGGKLEEVEGLRVAMGEVENVATSDIHYVEHVNSASLSPSDDGSKTLRYHPESSIDATFQCPSVEQMRRRFDASENASNASSSSTDIKSLKPHPLLDTPSSPFSIPDAPSITPDTRLSEPDSNAWTDDVARELNFEEVEVSAPPLPPRGGIEKMVLNESCSSSTSSLTVTFSACANGSKPTPPPRRRKSFVPPSQSSPPLPPKNCSPTSVLKTYSPPTPRPVKPPVPLRRKTLTTPAEVPNDLFDCRVRAVTGPALETTIDLGVKDNDNLATNDSFSTNNQKNNNNQPNDNSNLNANLEVLPNHEIPTSLHSNTFLPSNASVQNDNRIDNNDDIGDNIFEPIDNYVKFPLKSQSSSSNEDRARDAGHKPDKRDSLNADDSGVVFSSSNVSTANPELGMEGSDEEYVLPSNILNKNNNNNNSVRSDRSFNNENSDVSVISLSENQPSPPSRVDKAYEIAKEIVSSEESFLDILKLLNEDYRQHVMKYYDKDLDVEKMITMQDFERILKFLPGKLVIS